MSNNKLNKTILLLCLTIITGFTQAATLFEDFENPSVAATNNNGVLITYPSGQWFSYGITKPNTPTENDRKNGLYSIRMRGIDAKNTLEMRFDKVGAGVLSFKYGSFSNHSNGEFIIQKSINQGSNWEDVGTKVIVPKWSGTMLTYSVPVNYDGNIRFRLVVTLRTPNNANEQFNIDDFMITDFGTEQVAMPTSTVATGVYETPQTVTLNTTTNGATIYYTTDGTTPTAASNVYTTALNITNTTYLRAIAIASGKIDSRIEDMLISFPENIATLAEFYTKMATSGTNLTYYKYTGEAIVTTSYTATFKTLFMQDNTAGILITDNAKNTDNTYNIGDKVTGIIAQVNRINDTPQLFPYANFSIVSSNNSVTPTIVTLAQVPDFTYQLVQINDLSFTEADGTKKFGPNSPLAITDASITSTTTTTFRTPANMPNPDYINQIIPEKRNVIVLVAKNSAAVTTHHIFARNAAELNVQTSNVRKTEVTNIRINNNSIVFDTTKPETVKIFTVGGQMLRNIVSVVGTNTIKLDKGVYIIRIGDKTAKVLL